MQARRAPEEKGQTLASDESHTEDCRLFEASSHRMATPSLLMDTVHSCTYKSATHTTGSPESRRFGANSNLKGLVPVICERI